MKVKICGIKSLSIALHAIQRGADFLGFVFAKSKRQIEPKMAAQIIQELPAHVQTVGVFVNESQETIERIVKETKIDFIQLHGQESPEFCQEMPRPVIKAFSIKEPKDAYQIHKYDCAYYLVDSPGIQYAGGSGIPFNWEWLEEVDMPREQLILAGGLTPDNVQEAIRLVRPAIVDVSSGVETNEEKDPQKISAFIERVKDSRIIEQ